MITIIVSGGIVQEVVSDKPINIVVRDYDSIDGAVSVDKHNEAYIEYELLATVEYPEGE